eukprot:14345-Heterococcus_DN1.PRE.2
MDKLLREACDSHVACATTKVTAAQAAHCKVAFQRKHIGLNHTCPTHKLDAVRLIQHKFIRVTTIARATVSTLMALTNVDASAQQAS